MPDDLFATIAAAPRYPEHPAAELFPMMAGQALTDLAADIGANGLRDAISLLGGAILDGRNRQVACAMAGVEPRFEEVAPGIAPIAFVLSRNLNRRHLTESQRAMIAAKAATMPQGARTDLPSIDGRLSQADAAKLLNVGTATVERAAVVRREGVPELGEAVERGEIAVSEAAQIAKKPAPEQREILKRPTAAAARKQARDTGEPVVARDGREYDGRSADEERAEAVNTEILFRVIQALEALSGLGLTPQEYFDRLPDDPSRYLDEAIEGHVDAAAEWLAEFSRIWEAHRGSD